MRIAIALIALLLLAGSASARAAHPQRFTLYTANAHGRDLPVVVRASGAIDAVGSETQTDIDTRGGQLNRVTLHFAKGTVKLVAPERFAWAPDFPSCSATASGSGTFTITGGTGTYRRASGKGTFTSRGVALGARSSDGTCLPKAQPAADYVIVTMTGTIALP
jgi:hypothetical protein